MARIKLVLAMALMGTIGIFTKNIPLQSHSIALLRAVFAAVTLGIYLLVTRPKLQLRAVAKDLTLLILSGACLGLNWTFLFEAYNHIPYSVATLCDYFTPVVVMVLAPIVFKEKLTLRQVGCFFAATVGLVLLIGVGSGEPVKLHGVLIGLTGMLFYVPVMLINKALGHISSIWRTFLQFVTAAALLLLIAPMTGSADFSQMTAFGWCNAAIIGVVHTAVIYRICFSSLAKLPGQEGAILTYADPLVAMLVSVFVMHETITATQILGAVLLLGFTLLNELSAPHKGSLYKHG